MVELEIAVSVDKTIQGFGDNYHLAINDNERAKTDKETADFIKGICSQHEDISFNEEWQFYLGITGRQDG